MELGQSIAAGGAMAEGHVDAVLWHARCAVNPSAMDSAMQAAGNAYGDLKETGRPAANE
jgi:hypothetical protein